MALKSPTRAAADLLDTVWWEDDADERRLPVDPFQIAESLGIDVYLTDMDDDVSGALRRTAHGRPVIYLNRHDSRARQRFTCGHELGHYVKRTAEKNREFEFIDFRSTLAAAGVDEDEIFANQFAAELLMPRALVKQLRDRGLVGLAATFNVSTQAMGLRLRNLGLA